MTEIGRFNAANATIVPLDELGARLSARVSEHWRIAHLTARRIDRDQFALVAVLLAASPPRVEVWEAQLDRGAECYPSMTHDIPSVHWYERFIADLFGLLPVGHPRFKSVIFHDSWPEGFFPLRTLADKAPAAGDKPANFGFVPVRGEGVFEIAVGPIHAGIIEPGHFRFSCLGEVIQNLDIRLGYVHRGIEKRLEGAPPARVRLLAEAASTDTTVGNALAHALAVESLCDATPPYEAVNLRTVALEIERIACHVGDMGGVCSDIGFQAGAATFGRLRGRVLGMAERLTGSRFMNAYIVPGGVARPLSVAMRAELMQETNAVSAAFASAEPVLLDNFGALERMEGIGRLRPSVARDLGVLGPAGRASGVRYDVREWLCQKPYAECGWSAAYADESDAFARVRIRAIEVAESLKLIRRILETPQTGSAPLVFNSETHPGSKTRHPSLKQGGEIAESRARILGGWAANRVGVGIVEAWRGELVHLIFTDSNGEICRYAIKDPSTNNWSGLAHAVRGELVTDFPLCNKSFGLSYSGNDL